MSITVTEIVLHQLQKNEAESLELTTHLREELLTINYDVEQMMLELHQAYQTKSKSYGIFQKQSAFAQQLNQLLEKEHDFLSFSHICTKMLAQELGKYVFTTGGIFILARYNFLATDYLFMALIDSKDSIFVDEKLEVKKTSYLEILQYDLACRINLTDLQINAKSNRYLTFVKGRIGRKVADFFMDFLAAEEGLNPKLQNQSLLQAVNDYCEQGELNNEQTKSVKKQVFDYCKAQINSGEEIAIQTLSSIMPTLKEQSFATFSQNSKYELAENIPPVKNELKTLTKYAGSGKGITLSFDAQLLGERVIWDEINDTLILKGVPANLKDQLVRNKS